MKTKPAVFGIRREDKNEWEKRVPLIPSDIHELLQENDLEVIVQPSTIRVFNDDEYRQTGAIIDESLSAASTIFAVKEIPTQMLEKEKTYVFFSHTIKGQPYNMGMLKKLMDLKCNLIDYEKISDNNNARVITFSRFAGMAGLIETLYAYARKMEMQGISTPFRDLKQAYQYPSIETAKEDIAGIGQEISKGGMPQGLHPLSIGLLGYGNVSIGAQQILELLPVKELTPEQLTAGLNPDELDNRFIYVTIFEEKHMVKPLSGAFNLSDYYQHPEKYVSDFDAYVNKLNILVNCVFWTEDYPRTITREGLRKLPAADIKLEVIGDISCDIEGSIEITKDSTKPDNACYTYFADKDDFKDGIQGKGITVMAIDNLPCEFPKESSSSFSSELNGFVKAIVTADFNTDFENLKLPNEVKKALILHNGQLTPDFRYISEIL